MLSFLNKFKDCSDTLFIMLYSLILEKLFMQKYSKVTKDFRLWLSFY